jgi:hypothetical protein
VPDQWETKGSDDVKQESWDWREAVIEVVGCEIVAELWQWHLGDREEA